METASWRTRIFSDEPDRAAFILYFLGAVVPLIGLALIIDRYALPTLSGASEAGLIALLVSVGVLTFGSFLVLRRLIHRALSRMDRDNERLTGLLSWSHTLGEAQHVTDVLASATARALEMERAHASYAFLKGDETAAPSLAYSAGADAERLYRAHEREIEEVVRSAVTSGRPAMRDAQRADGVATAAVPLPPNAIAQGAFAVLKADAGGFDAGELDALSTLASMSAVALHNADLRDAQRNFFSHVTDILVTALDAHLGFHRGHGQRVAQLANRVGRRLGIDDDELSRLHFAALLHDIGMLKLDRNQQMSRASCERHCVLGHRMLSRIRLWREIAPIVYHHHEWFDGSGYPDGRAGAEIPRESRIIALCDAVDSMTSEDSYKTPLPLDIALLEVERCSGSQFDPEIVAAFAELARDGMIEIGPPPPA